MCRRVGWTESGVPLSAATCGRISKPTRPIVVPAIVPGSARASWPALWPSSKLLLSGKLVPGRLTIAPQIRQQKKGTICALSWNHEEYPGIFPGLARPTPHSSRIPRTTSRNRRVKRTPDSGDQEIVRSLRGRLGHQRTKGTDAVFPNGGERKGRTHVRLAAGGALLAMEGHSDGSAGPLSYINCGVVG